MQGLLGFSLLALLVLALMTASSAQEAAEQQQEERQLTLTKELVEYLLGVLSPQCRHEMEQALESQQKGDLSDACRQEVVYLAKQQIQQQEGDPELLQQHQQQQQQKQKPRTKKGPVAAPSNVILTMVGFFALAVAGIAAAIFYINSKRRGSWGERRSKGAKHTKKEMLAASQKKK